MKVMSENLTENASEPDALSLITSFLSHLIIFIEAFKQAPQFVLVLDNC